MTCAECGQTFDEVEIYLAHIHPRSERMSKRRIEDFGDEAHTHLLEIEPGHIGSVGLAGVDLEGISAYLTRGAMRVVILVHPPGHEGPCSEYMFALPVLIDIEDAHHIADAMQEIAKMTADR